MAINNDINIRSDLTDISNTIMHLYELSNYFEKMRREFSSLWYDNDGDLQVYLSKIDDWELFHLMEEFYRIGKDVSYSLSLELPLINNEKRYPVISEYIKMIEKSVASCKKEIYKLLIESKKIFLRKEKKLGHWKIDRLVEIHKEMLVNLNALKNEFKNIKISERYKIENNLKVDKSEPKEKYKINSSDYKSTEFEFDVALSFAGEDREYVEKVARYLTEKDIKVFYDKYEKTKLWGKDLYVHLDEIYQKKAKYCVMFLSSYYAEKLWTNHERKSAQARAFKEKGEYILPARFDETEVPGILPTVGYIDLRSLEPEEFGKLVIEKLKKSTTNILRNIDIFQKQSESKKQGKKIFNEKGVTEKEIPFLASNAWDKIKNEFGVSKLTFGRKIYFVKDKFKRKIIFRDTLNAYMLAENSFNKAAVILAGSIIEELLRLYLEYRNIRPSKNNFNEYIKLCESKGILKKGISKLSDSVRHFRNIVHLEKEIDPKYTISKAAAKNAVSSIFIISNDFLK